MTAVTLLKYDDRRPDASTSEGSCGDTDRHLEPSNHSNRRLVLHRLVLHKLVLHRLVLQRPSDLRPVLQKLPDREHND